LTASNLAKRIELMRRVLTLLLLALMAVVGSTPAARAQKAAPTSQADPDYVTPPAWKSVEIGDFYFRRKSYRGALSRYQEAIHTDPGYAPAYLGLGKVYEKMGLKKKALKAYQRYLDELPSEKQADEAKDVHRAIERLKREVGNPRANPSNRR
jgi:tetratricopeptide (TPR) repeat protein